jgi:hypothetical protein
MGSGVWTTSSYTAYSTSVGRSVVDDPVKGVVTLSSNYTAQDLFTSSKLQPELNPRGVIRECLDTEEHPNTIPVILALDVTGSMGSAAAEVAKKLNEVMTKLYEKVTDVEFMIMGIGDLAYDCAPLQISQFESDVRIAEQLDKIYFEGGGGGNSYESYTGAWYLGLRHTKLDCWNRGRKGIIITMGDEPLNPYLPKETLEAATGDSLQGDVETKDLYKEVAEKFDIYHLAVDDRATSYYLFDDVIRETFGKYLDSDHLKVVNLDNIASTIVSIVSECANNTEYEATTLNTNSEISW